jgi:hypothetical protein
MDSLITAAAHALAAADPLGALNFIALRDDAPALALRGIAMAQLGDLARARLLIRRAGRTFGPKEAVARARCVVAEAEIALVSRDLNWPVKTLEAARATLQARGDAANAAHARHLAIRRLTLIGHVREAERLLEGFDPAPLPPALRAAHELVVAGIALRHLKTKPAREAFVRAGQAAHAAGIPALIAEVETAAMALTTPAARLIRRGEETLLLLHEVEALLASKSLVIDAGRAVVRQGETVVALDSRPVLLALARGALRKSIAGGTELRAFSQPIMEACLKASNEVNAETSAANADFKKVLESMQAFRNDGYFWWQVAEYSYDTFMIRSRPRG